MARAALIQVDQHRPAAETIDRAVTVLERGELVVAPTETRYGLLVKAGDSQALERLYRLKQRSINLPTALFVPDQDGLWILGEENPVARCLAQRFLPGPLTVVLKARPNWGAPRVVEGKIGVRWSSSPLIQALVRRLDWYPSATSANISGQPEPETARQIADLFGDAVGLYLESGPLTGLSSTVVDCSGPSLQIVREGAIAVSDITETLQKAGIRYA